MISVIVGNLTRRIVKLKYYIGSVTGSGLKVNTLGDSIEYLRDMAMTAEEQGEDWFEINVETYLSDKSYEEDI